MRHDEVSGMVEQHVRMTLDWSAPPGEMTSLNAALRDFNVAV